MGTKLFRKPAIVKIKNGYWKIDGTIVFLFLMILAVFMISTFIEIG